MQSVGHHWKRNRRIAAALAAGAVFQISSCSVSDEGVITAFADPSGFADLGAQLHEDSLLGRVFDIGGTVEINFGGDD